MTATATTNVRNATPPTIVAAWAILAAACCCRLACPAAAFQAVPLPPRQPAPTAPAAAAAAAAARGPSSVPRFAASKTSSPSSRPFHRRRRSYNYPPTAFPTTTSSSTTSLFVTSPVQKPDPKQEREEGQELAFKTETAKRGDGERNQHEDPAAVDGKKKQKQQQYSKHALKRAVQIYREYATRLWNETGVDARRRVADAQTRRLAQSLKQSLLREEAEVAAGSGSAATAATAASTASAATATTTTTPSITQNGKHDIRQDVIDSCDRYLNAVELEKQKKEITDSEQPGQQQDGPIAATTTTTTTTTTLEAVETYLAEQTNGGAVDTTTTAKTDKKKKRNPKKTKTKKGQEEKTKPIPISDIEEIGTNQHPTNRQGEDAKQQIHLQQQRQQHQQQQTNDSFKKDLLTKSLNGKGILANGNSRDGSSSTTSTAVVVATTKSTTQEETAAAAAANGKPKKQRRSIAFGAMMGLVVAGWVFSGNYIFTGLFTLMTVLGQLEYYRMIMNTGIYPARRISIVGACSMFVTALVAPNLHQICLPLFGLYAMVWFLTMKRTVTTIPEIATTFTGMFYLGYVPSFWVRIRVMNDTPTRELTRLAPLVGPWLSRLVHKSYSVSWVPDSFLQAIHLPITTGSIFIFWTWLCLAFSDVGAYFVGKSLGRTKLGAIAPAAGATSPNKTVEGVIGGCAVSALLAIVGAWVQKWPMFVLTGAVHGFLLGLLGLIGDLTASMLKRDAGLKDFGDLLPEHGGIMDRVDSFVWTAPYSWLVCVYVIPALKNWVR